MTIIGKGLTLFCTWKIEESVKDVIALCVISLDESVGVVILNILPVDQDTTMNSLKITKKKPKLWPYDFLLNHRTDIIKWLLFAVQINSPFQRIYFILTYMMNVLLSL